MTIFRSKALFVASVVAPLFGHVARAEAPSGRYTISSGTVFDTKTKLTWQRQTTPPTAAYTWAEAKTYCKGLGTGWRLPSIKELATLVDDSATPGPKIDSAFPDTVGEFYWSSTALVDFSPPMAWGLSFDLGYSDSNITGDSYRVRCVR